MRYIPNKDAPASVAAVPLPGGVDTATPVDANLPRVHLNGAMPADSESDPSKPVDGAVETETQVDANLPQVHLNGYAASESRSDPPPQQQQPLGAIPENSEYSNPYQEIEYGDDDDAAAANGYVYQQGDEYVSKYGQRRQLR